jgi:hypothetical protein
MACGHDVVGSKWTALGTDSDLSAKSAGAGRKPDAGGVTSRLSGGAPAPSAGHPDGFLPSQPLLQQPALDLRPSVGAPNGPILLPPSRKGACGRWDRR